MRSHLLLVLVSFFILSGLAGCGDASDDANLQGGGKDVSKLGGGAGKEILRYVIGACRHDLARMLVNRGAPSSCRGALQSLKRQALEEVSPKCLQDVATHFWESCPNLQTDCQNLVNEALGCSSPKE